MQSLGDLFKDREKQYAQTLPTGGVIVRIDGKAFHTFTRGLHKPFDERMTSAMRFTTLNLCTESDIPVRFAYTQSDEISLYLDTEFFGNKVQKIVSVVASYAAGYFSQVTPKTHVVAVFDARAFSVEPEEVVPYFLWRKADANRNAIAAAAQSVFSHKQLQGVSKADQWSMLNEHHPEMLPLADRHFNGTYFWTERVVQESEAYGGYVRNEWQVSSDNGMLDKLAEVVTERTAVQ